MCLSVWLRASWKREAIGRASSGDAEACGAESEQSVLIINCLNAFGVKPVGVRILAVVPSILGSDGSAVNERQFLRELCRSNKCFIITLIPLTLLKELRRLISGLQTEHGSYDVNQSWSSGIRDYNPS
jgi:hypothetical protein